VQEGSAFAIDETACAELGDWFESAHRLLEEVVARHPRATQIRLWPHHFDLGTLIVEERGAASEVTRSVGVGLSPGDDGTGEPYWYVTPWPYPPSDGLPRLGGFGSWNTSGWIGAVLRGSELTDLEGHRRAAALAEFATSAISACLALVGD
jgi:hypothetical protein